MALSLAATRSWGSRALQATTHTAPTAHTTKGRLIAGSMYRPGGVLQTDAGGRGGASGEFRSILAHVARDVA
jgi:hypothetical protein